METKKCIETRRSIRKFTDKQVPEEAIQTIVSLASYAPSWKNSQVVRYYAVQKKSVKEEIADNCVLGYEGNAKIIKGAPTLMVITYKKGISGYEKSGEASTSKGDHWEVFDAGIATQTFCLAAHNLGYGTVIMGIFDEAKVAAAAKIPEGQTVAALVALGTPNIEPEAPKRKDVDTLLAFR